MQEGLKVWDEFTPQTTEANALIAGEGLQPSATATTVKVGEGSDRMVTEWAKKLPLSAGGSIEVRPVMDYSQFSE